MRNFTVLEAVSSHMTPWLRTEFGDYTDCSTLDAFVKNFFDATVKNLLTYLWVVYNSQRFVRSEPAEEVLAEDHMLRFFQYCLAEGFFAWPEFVHLTHAGSDTSSRLELLKGILRRALAQKAHIEDSPFIDAFLAFVFDAEATRKQRTRFRSFQRKLVKRFLQTKTILSSYSLNS